MDIALSVVETAKSVFGISSLKPYQLLVIHRIVEQDSSDTVRHQLVILPTGTGKSLCFLVPSVLCSGLTVIIYPLLALMNDQMRILSHAGINFACFRGGQTVNQRKREFEKINRGAKIIITNPETLENGKISKELKKHSIALLVCDELHVLTEWGRSFRPAYLKIGQIAKELQPHQIVGFTATADDTVIEDAKRILFPDTPLIVRGDADRENIFYRSLYAPGTDIGVVSVIKKCAKPAIVFCGTRNESYKLCVYSLARIAHVPMRYYHAGLSKSIREQIEEWFMHSDDGVLFATCAFGLGVSKNNIRTVIHAYFPSDVLEYLQESGRAGRDMKDAEAYVVVSPDNCRRAGKSPVKRIFTGSECRRIALLEELGERKDECCGCDVCRNEVVREYPGQHEILELIKRRPLRYSFSDVPWILGRDKDYRFVKDGFELDRWRGVLSDMDMDEIEKTVKALISKKDSPEKPLVSVNFGKRQGLLIKKCKLTNE